MTDNETVDDLILREHEAFRRSFLALRDLRPTGDTAVMSAAWHALAGELESHAKAEEELVYPVLLQQGGDDSDAETLDAIGDHNDIRDAIATASTLVVGSDDWWEAVTACRTANDEHLAEEERDVIPDLREHTSAELRRDVGRRWQAFRAAHRDGRGIVGEDVQPEEYVEANS